MPQLLPTLRLTSENGGCFRVGDNCMTLAAMKQAGGWNLTKSMECEDCCPACERELIYTGDPMEDGAWWAGSADPAAADFLGLLIDHMELESAATARRVGESSLTATEYAPRLLQIEGRLVSKSRAGTYFGETQLLALLQSASDWEATVRPFCDEDFVDEPIRPEVWLSDGNPELVDNPDACGPCDRLSPAYEPAPLLPPLLYPTVIDSGSRGLLNVRFLSMDTSEVDGTPTEYCFGKDIRIVFEVFDEGEWGDPIHNVCVIDRPFDTFESGYCRPHDWRECLLIPDSTSCVDDLAEVNSGLEDHRLPQRFDTNYCTPLYRSTRTCLTPVLPTSASVALDIRLRSGRKNLRNVRIDVYPAFVGKPAPDTCQGEQFYRRMETCATAYVAYVPAESVLRVDGRRSQTLLSCYGGAFSQSEGSIENWDYPLLDPDCRFWVVVTVDCLRSAPNAGVAVSYVPRFEA